MFHCGSWAFIRSSTYGLRRAGKSRCCGSKPPSQHPMKSAGARRCSRRPRTPPDIAPASLERRESPQIETLQGFAAFDLVHPIRIAENRAPDGNQVEFAARNPRAHVAQIVECLAAILERTL